MKKTIALISVLAGMAAVFTGCSVNIEVEPEEVTQVLENPAVSELVDKAAENVVLNINTNSASENKSSDKQDSNSADENISAGEQNMASESENISADEEASDNNQSNDSADENIPDNKNSHIVYPEGEPGFDGIDVDDMLCGTVGDDGEYYVVNFLKNKEFQNQINADIREVSDELYSYAEDYDYISDEHWNPNGTYSFNTKGLIMEARCENGYLGLKFHYTGEPDSDGFYKFDHITTLTYDIINEKKIESIDEFFTTNCYDELNDIFREKGSFSGKPFSEEITPSNIAAFTPWEVFISDSVFYYTDSASMKNDNGTFKYDIGKFYIPAYKRDMTDYIDPAYSAYHNHFYGK